ncbi:MAG: ATP synthase subunit I [Oscillospiraceae bacterium]|nr:ATP synthase subunit I [Oscillospiraceae bacterium]
MESRKFVLKETAVVLLGEVICSAAMVGIFALLGYYSTSVLLGAVIGSILATLNFFFMAVGATLAADKAEKQDVKGGKAMIQSSYTLRLIVLAIVLFAFAKSGLCNPVALVVPLIFVRPTITVTEFFRKSGEANS